MGRKQIDIRNLNVVYEKAVKDAPKSIRKIELEQCDTSCPRFADRVHCTIENCDRLKQKRARHNRLLERAFDIASGKVQDTPKRKQRNVPFRDRIMLKDGLFIGRGQANEWGLHDRAIYDDVSGDRQLWTLCHAKEIGECKRKRCTADCPDLIVTHLVTIYSVRDYQQTDKADGKNKKTGDVIRKVLVRVEVKATKSEFPHRFSHSSLFCMNCGKTRMPVPASYPNITPIKCPVCRKVLLFYQCQACLSDMYATQIVWEWYTKRRLPSIGANYAYVPYRYEYGINRIRKSKGRIWVD